MVGVEVDGSAAVGEEFGECAVAFEDGALPVGGGADADFESSGHQGDRVEEGEV